MSEKAITIFTSFLNEGVFLGLYGSFFFPLVFVMKRGFVFNLDHFMILPQCNLALTAGKITQRKDKNIVLVLF